jgi:uncharacterized protein YdaU (DUF1376 family)
MPSYTPAKGGAPGNFHTGVIHPRELTLNYYPFHLGDYAAHTAHLEPIEDLAYRRMLDAYYLREAPLPSDMPEVARLIRMRQNIPEVEAVLREFFRLTDEGWRHERCDEEILRMQDKQAKARASAAASVNARRAKAHSDLNARIANEERSLNERSTDVELPTPTPTPTPTPKEEREKTTQRATRSQAVACPVGVDPQVWADWLQLRKAKKAPVTQSALDRIEREAVHAGMSLQDALAHSCMRGWVGFKAEWMQSAQHSTAKPYSPEHKYAAAGRALFDGVFDD